MKTQLDICYQQSKEGKSPIQVGIACKKNSWYLPLASSFYIFYDREAKSSRGPSPL